MSTTRPTSHQTRQTISDLVKHPKSGTTELFLVRHGQTVANQQRLFVGATDVPLDPLGEKQAELVARRFSRIEIDALVSSPLRRALRTAQAISSVTGHEPEIVPGLSEIDFGRIEGLSLQQVLEQFPELQHHVTDYFNLDLEWPGGESRRGFATRVMTTFLGLLEQYERHRVAVVCHGGVIGSFLAQIDTGPKDDLLRYAVANCSISHLIVTPEHTRVELWNDHTHLAEVDIDPALIRPQDQEDSE